MATELRPGVFGAILTKVAVEGNARGRVALAETALIIERQAKINVRSGGTHKYGTRTPATPGSGPALISGTLRRSITHSPVTRIASGWETRVGTAAGIFPPYGKKRTASSRYGYHLETGLRNGTTYPWLLPAFRDGLRQARGVNAKIFGSRWPHL